MSDLTDFLLARIADDERFARDALARASIYDPARLRWNWMRTDGESTTWEPTTYDPARVLRECEAKRRIVEDCIHLEPRGMLLSHARWACRVLATVYADHPDYREEWKP